MTSSGYNFWWRSTRLGETPAKDTLDTQQFALWLLNFRLTLCRPFCDRPIPLIAVTHRLYYTAQRLTEFSATIVALEHDGTHVVLDRTAFYPTSGGQPHDIGVLGAVPVTDVIDEDDHVVHVCATPLTHGIGDTINGTVNWHRRYDYMQQHTGQHLLSAHLADQYNWPTVSVHFGDTSSTVDVAASDIPPNVVEAIEREVNQLATENRAVTVAFENADTAVGLRKASDRGGELRIVTIDGIDRSACGGTHVNHTGEIGAILLRRAERTKGHVRLEFICGARAVTRARTDAQLLGATARMFTAAPESVPALVEAQQQRVVELERDRKRLKGELAAYHAQALWDAAAPDDAGVRRIRLPEYATPVKDADAMVQALLAIGPCVVLALSPSTGGVLLGASDGSGVNAGAVLKAFLQNVGGRGGGSPRVAQGNIPGAFDVEATVHAVLTTESK